MPEEGTEAMCYKCRSVATHIEADPGLGPDRPVCAYHAGPYARAACFQELVTAELFSATAPEGSRP